jgi:FtsP/CotA-like multicopper oxidase with cupredoxin domain
MGMGSMSGMNMASMDHDTKKPAAMPEMPGMDHGSMPEMKGMDMSGGMQMPMDHGDMQMGGTATTPKLGVEVDNVAMIPEDRLGEAGTGLNGNGRRVLRYTDLKAVKRGDDQRPPSHEITLHLTGNMQRFIWGFDGRKFSEAEPIELERGERVRFVLINDSMMEHPIHLHGLWSELDNGQGEFRPYKHTVLVKPGERLSYLVTADEPGRWAYHCHLLYHMEMGMFREVHVS